MRKITLLIVCVVFLASGLFAGGAKDTDETILRIGTSSNGPTGAAERATGASPPAN